MKVLVADDDRVLADVIAFTLRRESFEVIQAYDGNTALQRWEQEQPALIILDVNMPKMDGFEVCRRIREKGDTPIILLTVRGEEDDIIQGLETGADDYITKPFSPRQLVARCKAVLRRAGESPRISKFQIGDLAYIPEKRLVKFISTNEEVSLTPLENRLLRSLIINAGQVLTFEIIIDEVWGPAAGDRDMIRQLVRRLRMKIEKNPAEPVYLQTFPGLGYGFISESEFTIN
jgi:DNA-binding response OmpR family regulator